MNKPLKIAKAALAIAFSLLVTCLAFILKIIFEMATNENSSQDNESNNFYVIDEKGNEIIDDGVTHVFELENQRDYKWPIL